MGFKEWLQRKIELTREKNVARSEALRSYYKSDDYKKAVADAEKQKLKEGKGSDFSSWLKKVSSNAANNLQSEKINFDINKLKNKK